MGTICLCGIEADYNLQALITVFRWVLVLNMKPTEDVYLALV